MPQTLVQFTAQLVDSRLMSAADVEAFVAALKRPPADGQGLARELVRHKKLTAYQAQQIYSGKGKQLVLGNYRILDTLGQGGMGMVFKAEHQRMKRLVALKMLSPLVTDSPEAVLRFQREVEAAARLRHANIVAADDADEARGVHFLVMEYVEGSDLAAWVKRYGVMPLDKALACIIQAARGLDYAHRNGVVHRDIKPANLLLDRDGTLKILDMGLARLASAGANQDELTGTGQIMGTVDYMAPEQAVSTREADGRSDIYSLGVTLWYLLTARPMYDGESAIQKLMGHRIQEIPSLSARRSDVTPTIEAVFNKMVAKSPSQRYQSMAELIAELEKCQAAEASVPPVQSTAGEDTRLDAFLRGIAEPSLGGAPLAARTLQRVAQTAVAPMAEQGVTVNMGQPQTDTNPQVTPPLVAAARRLLPNMSRAKRSLPPRPVLLVAAAAAAMVLLLGIWVIVRDKDGNEVARIQVPEEGKVEVRSDDQPASVASNSANNAAALPTATAVSPPVASVAPPTAVAPFDASRAKSHQEAWAKYLKVDVEFENSLGARFRLIPPGEFTMGNTQEEMQRWRDKQDKADVRKIMISEVPEHPVRITKAFYAGIHEVTFREFRSFAREKGFKPDGPGFKWVGVWASDPDCTWEKPGWTPSDDEPVVCIALADARAFCAWLSRKEERTWRLPTEAEWEYMARAGTTTAFWTGPYLPRTAARVDNVVSRPANVGSYPANPFGLFDIHGNVWERTGDWYDAVAYRRGAIEDPVGGPPSSGYTADRGGGWYHGIVQARCANRGYSEPNNRVTDKGFRIVCEVGKGG
jgi:formylglycine-generating enzyme required for sulfatase activity